MVFATIESIIYIPQYKKFYIKSLDIFFFQSTKSVFSKDSKRIMRFKTKKGPTRDRTRDLKIIVFPRLFGAAIFHSTCVGI